MDNALWFMVYGLWFRWVEGSGLAVSGIGSLNTLATCVSVQCLWFMFMVYGYGVWFMVYGLWFMVYLYGVWLMVYGLWFMV